MVDPANQRRILPTQVTTLLTSGTWNTASWSNGMPASITTGTVNLAWRRSENWNLTLDYAWTGYFGGTFEVYGRWIGYQRYERMVLPNTPVVDELRAHPAPESYLDYLRLKLRQAAAALGR